MKSSLGGCLEGAGSVLSSQSPAWGHASQPPGHQSHTHMSCARAFTSSGASIAFAGGVVSAEEAMLAGPLSVCLLVKLWVLNARPRLRCVQPPRTRWVGTRVQCIQSSRSVLHVRRSPRRLPAKPDNQD